MKNIITFFFLVSLVGCASGNLSVQSFPEEAEVWAAPHGHGQPKLLGKTPLYMKSSEIMSKFDGSRETYHIEVRKKGFKSDHVYVTDLLNSKIKMDTKMDPAIAWTESQQINDLIDSFFEVRRMVDAKQYNRALEILAQLKTSYPHLSVVYELEGGIQTILGEYWAGLESYTKAYDYNPENLSLSVKIEQLRRALDLPSSSRVNELGRIPSAVGGEEN